MIAMKRLLLLSVLFSVSALAANPVIYPVAASCGVTFAHIVWSTDIAADSTVNYGTSTSYGSNVAVAGLVTWHKLTISGLTPNTLYHYRVASGGSVSPDYTFTTYANPGGTVRTVGAGKTHATIQACANVAQAGDTCLVYAGTYNESVTSVRSGSSGNPITFLAQEPALVKAFNMGSFTYQSIKGFEIDNGSGSGISGSRSHNATVENNYIHPFGGRGISIPDSGPANDVVLRKNIIYHAGWGNGGSGSEGIYAYGDRLLSESNDISHCADFNQAGGANIVIRNNVWHHGFHNELPGSSEHIDGLQITGNTFNYSLVENNVEYVCSDSTGNCHFFIVRNQTAPAADNIIMRHNFACKIASTGINIGGSGDNVPNTRFYNNTVALEGLDPENGGAISFQNATGGVVLNNIFYNSVAGPWSPHVGAARFNKNITLTTGYSGEWNSPYSTEGTYSALKNKNPLFANYPYDASIQSTSPAKDAGAPLTSVGGGDSGSGTSLIVNDARFFQPGWAGTQADWIAVGSVSNVVQISSINYTSGTITLAGNMSRSAGDSVWLYKKSDGVRVLYGTAPDIGAFEAGTTGTPVLSAPSNLRIIP